MDGWMEVGRTKKCSASRLAKNLWHAKGRKPPVLAQKTSGQIKKKLQNFLTFSPLGSEQERRTTATTRVHTRQRGVRGCVTAEEGREEGVGVEDMQRTSVREHAWRFAAFVWWSLGHPAAPRAGRTRHAET
jgi:hypothetical protein